MAGKQKKSKTINPYEHLSKIEDFDLTMNRLVEIYAASISAIGGKGKPKKNDLYSKILWSFLDKVNLSTNKFTDKEHDEVLRKMDFNQILDSYTNFLKALTEKYESKEQQVKELNQIFNENSEKNLWLDLSALAPCKPISFLIFSKDDVKAASLRGEKEPRKIAFQKLQKYFRFSPYSSISKFEKEQHLSVFKSKTDIRSIKMKIVFRIISDEMISFQQANLLPPEDISSLQVLVEKVNNLP